MIWETISLTVIGLQKEKNRYKLFETNSKGSKLAILGYYAVDWKLVHWAIFKCL